MKAILKDINEFTKEIEIEYSPRPYLEIADNRRLKNINIFEEEKSVPSEEVIVKKIVFYLKEIKDDVAYYEEK